ncbi:LysE family translocator [Pseudorhodoferax sp.]|uniref:LysE family translocator n=1 Tax=Pseudorhodoferax sp. TaxID=1993553 RepID=UPI002DD66BD4|nr:LysE family translocator [Pseudorhodoferax sp.]
MTVHAWLLFLATALVSTLMPGPSSALCLAHGAAHGPRRAFYTALGVNVAVLCLMALSAVGVGAILSASSATFQVLKTVGALFLGGVGIAMWRSSGAADATVQDDAPAVEAHRATRGRLFLMGLFTGAANPKALLFFFALFPQFIRPEAPRLGQFALLAVTWMVCEMGALLAYAVGGQRLSGWLRQRRAVPWLHRVCALLLIAVAIWLGLVS